LSKVELTHNHLLSPGKQRFFRSNKKRNDAAKSRLGLNDRAGICLSKNFNSLVVESGGLRVFPLEREIAGIISSTL